MWGELRSTSSERKFDNRRLRHLRTRQRLAYGNSRTDLRLQMRPDATGPMWSVGSYYRAMSNETVLESRYE
jgi:hypothetical protein